ncbi:hypothetical protein [Algoriphagus sp. NG3]|uniref:hypothetical protein n=1 Tax=Algoriphagus sp. NG3 TaxID=3097546 RepID=UPI002A810199|nr:hypothetical protein [Algoriphagus sp. NG3]WPR75226.1 hypothetical protein SLW71_21425 [Algoriphagus sp. NG3]
MKMTNFFRGFNWWLFASAIISFGLILCINLWFSNISGVFDNASKIGDINTALLCSYLAAYVFYLITSYYKEFKNRKSSKIPLSYNLIQIMIAHHNYLKTINLATKSDFLELDEKEKRDVLTLVKITDSPPKIHDSITISIPKTWNEYLTWHRRVQEKSIREIYKSYAFVMEDELRDILSNIENSLFYDEINKSYQRPDIYKNLNSLFDSMQQYIKFFERLNVYVERM